MVTAASGPDPVTGDPSREVEEGEEGYCPAVVPEPDLEAPVEAGGDVNGGNMIEMFPGMNAAIADLGDPAHTANQSRDMIAFHIVQAGLATAIYFFITVDSGMEWTAARITSFCFMMALTICVFVTMYRIFVMYVKPGYNPWALRSCFPTFHVCYIVFSVVSLSIMAATLVILAIICVVVRGFDEVGQLLKRCFKNPEAEVEGEGVQVVVDLEEGEEIQEVVVDLEEGEDDVD